MSMCFESNYGIKSKIISPDDGYHYFFGYYDMRADDGTHRHLCHRVSFIDRLPLPEDIAEVGYLEDRRFVKIGETSAWNFQQGAMLEYHPTKKDTVYYARTILSLHLRTTSEQTKSIRPTAPAPAYQATENTE